MNALVMSDEFSLPSLSSQSIRASSSNVTIRAWLMCWKASMSDHRTVTKAS